MSVCIQPECRYSWEPDIEREVCLDCQEVHGFGDLCSTSCRDEHYDKCERREREMDIDEARNRVEQIRSEKCDDELAHGHEDALWHDVLKAIAAGNEDARELAKAALCTQEIVFARWCA